MERKHRTVSFHFPIHSPQRGHRQPNVAQGLPGKYYRKQHIIKESEIPIFSKKARGSVIEYELFYKQTYWYISFPENINKLDYKFSQFEGSSCCG